MNDRGMEQRLRAFYDDQAAAAHAPNELWAAVASVPGQAARDIRVDWRRAWVLLAAAVATALLAGSLIAIGTGGLHLSRASQTPAHLASSELTSPSPQNDIAFAPACPTVPPAAPGPTNGSSQPIGSEIVDLQPVVDGPSSRASIVTWAGGVLAVDEVGAPDFSSSDTGGAVGAFPLDAWVSADGQTWQRLPQDTFDTDNFTFGLAPLGDSVIVMTESAQGRRTAWLSRDGTTWTSSPAPSIELTRGLYPWPPLQLADVELAGGPLGVVGLIGSDDPSVRGDVTAIAFSPDGRTWQTTTLPGDGNRISAVAAFGAGGFVAVGSSGSPSTNTTWWSPDGLEWRVTSEDGPGTSVYAGSGGLVAESWAGLGCGSFSSYFVSMDGRSWTPLVQNPLGLNWHDGYLQGDGTRLLWYSVGRGPTVFLTSSDGVHWAALTLKSHPPASTGGAITQLAGDSVLLLDTVDGSARLGSLP